VVTQAGQVLDLGKIAVQYVPVYFALADVDTPISHSLGRTILGCSVVDVDTYCRIKSSTMPKGKFSLSLVCDTAGVTALIRIEAMSLRVGR
jgi:hypothetical protein